MCLNFPCFPFRRRQTFRVFSKADPTYSVTIRDGRVILARSDPSDELQHWYKEDYGTRVNDVNGFPSFALVNKATGQAMKHAIGDTHPVQLKSYSSAESADVLDESILWTEANDELGEGFRAIRMAHNTGLNVDAFVGEEKSGGGSVRDGTTVGLWQWHGGDNQIWKIIPY
ncbi:ricin B-like lectin EULS3 [Corylus avellana]|uniref:ricin B-like lectin EULS3 n=1 Tax=Corylus avellana TaxID=13451 RepID=UPI001E1EE922|nr:ricin B-like lectin EULS3 [Corylus avellana]